MSETKEANTAEGKRLVDDMLAAGFTQQEVGEWAADQRKTLSGAGFSDQEIDDWFGADPAPKVPKALLDRVAQGNAFTRVLAAAQKGASNAFGDEQVGFSSASEKWLRDAGIFADPETGRAGPVRFLNEAIMRPAAAGLDALSRALDAGLGGFSAAAGQIATEAGSDRGKALERDLNMMGQIAGIELGKVPFTRVERLPNGGARDVTVAYGLPTRTDFHSAATALAQSPDPALVAKLERLYNERGLHPAEVVFDASRDVTLAQELLSSVDELPPAYRGKPSAETVAKAQEPATANAAESKILEKISVGVKEPGEKMSFERLYTQVLDDLNPIRQEVKAMGGKAKPSDDPYVLARLSRGTFGKADQFLEYAPYDFNTYENVGKSLKDILAPVNDDLNGLRAYAVAKRAIELEGRGIKSGVDFAAAKDVVAAGGRYESIVAGLAEYQNHLTRYLRDSGILSHEAFDAMREANKDYVPFYRMMDDRAGGPSSRGGVSNPIKGIKGSDRDIVDPIESIIKNTYAYVALAERNAVGRAFIDMANKSGKPEDFAVRVNPAVQGVTVSDAEMRAFLKAHGIDKVPEDLLSVFRSARRPLAKNEIAVFEDGKRAVYQIDPDVAQAFKAADASTANLLVQVLAIPAKALRAGSVLSPDFMLRNAVRDQMGAAILSKSGYLPVFDMVRGAISLARKDGDFQNWLKSGGANSAMVALDREYLQQSIAKLTKETGLGTRAWNVAKSPLEFLRIASELTENATRLGEFKRAAAGATDKASIQAAGFASREVTLDFARIGAQTRAVNMISAFFNAHVQGLDRTARAFIEKPIGTTAKVGAGITLPSVLLYLANREDPRWQEIPRWQKDLFWIVMTKDHVFRIPKPFELGLVFGSLPERVLEAYEKRDPAAFKDLEKSIFQAFIPNMMPTVAAPVIEQFANRSLFTGGPVIPWRLEGLLPEYQYTEYTTETAKALGAMIGAVPGVTQRAVRDQETMVGGIARALTTPVLLENYLRAWTGGLGTYALQIADKGLREAGALPDPPKPAATLADIPFVKAFVIRHPSAGAQSIQDFYDQYEANKRVWNTFMAKAKEGDAEAVGKTLAAGQNALFQLDGIREALGEHSNLVRMIYKNPDIPADEKRQLIDTLYFRMIELARAGNQITHAVSSKGGANE